MFQIVSRYLGAASFALATLLSTQSLAQDLGSGTSVEGSGKNVPVVIVCANAADHAEKIASWFSDYFWGKEHHSNLAHDPKGEDFNSKKQELISAIENSKLPLTQKARLQGLISVLWNATYRSNINPADVATSYYLHCMDMVNR